MASIGVIGVLNIGSEAASTYNNGALIGAVILSSSGQIIATIASCNPAAVIATAPGAMTATVGKIMLDYTEGGWDNVKSGDMISIVGNGIAITGALADFIPGAQPIALAAMLVGGGLTAIGIMANHNEIANAASALIDKVNSGLIPQLSLALSMALGGDGSLGGGTGDGTDGHDRTGGAAAGMDGGSAAIPPRRYDPLLIDLNGDGISTTAVNRYGAHFDLDANGLAESVGWVNPDDGLKHAA